MFPKDQIVNLLKYALSILEDKPEQPVVVQNDDKFKWTELYTNLIHRAADENTPMSQRTITYLQRKLPNTVSYAALTAKIRRMGYSIKKGKICSRA